jgi:threonine synthase
VALGRDQRAAMAVCGRCGTVEAASPWPWRCRCRGLWRPQVGPFDPAAVIAGERSVWRYRAMLSLGDGPAVSLGEGGTPLQPANLDGVPVQLKLEYLQPTGSYKDRGMAVLVTALAAAGVTACVEDSSGNAGASLAAYAAHAGIQARLFVPQATPTTVLRQQRAHGAVVDRVAATRHEAAARAQAACGDGVAYASHVFSPFFLLGTMTLAFEVWEQLGRRVPDRLVLPVGHGGLLLGAYHGFTALQLAGLADRLPRLIAVQAAACAPLEAAFRRGEAGVAAAPPGPLGPTAARGVAVAHPPRGAEVLAAVRATGGAVVAVDEGEIRRAQASCARAGWYVEPTGAVAAAGLGRLVAGRSAPPESELTVVALTGTGLKE